MCPTDFCGRHQIELLQKVKGKFMSFPAAAQVWSGKMLFAAVDIFKPSVSSFIHFFFISSFWRIGLYAFLLLKLLLLILKSAPLCLEDLKSCAIFLLDQNLAIVKNLDIN